MLPFPEKVVQQIDYNSILRLVLCYFWMKNLSIQDESSSPKAISMYHYTYTYTCKYYIHTSMSACACMHCYMPEVHILQSFSISWEHFWLHLLYLFYCIRLFVHILHMSTCSNTIYCICPLTCISICINMHIIWGHTCAHTHTLFKPGARRPVRAWVLEIVPRALITTYVK